MKLWIAKNLLKYLFKIEWYQSPILKTPVIEVYLGGTRKLLLKATRVLTPNPNHPYGETK